MKKQFTLLVLMAWSLTLFTQTTNTNFVALLESPDQPLLDQFINTTLIQYESLCQPMVAKKPEAGFVSSVNCCDQDGVVDLCYLSGADFCGNGGFCPEYSLDGDWMVDALRVKLNSPNNFGPNGIVDCNMNLKELEDVSSVQAITDCGCDIIFLPSVFVDPVTNQQNLDVTFIPQPIMQNIYDWSIECENNIVITTQGEAAFWGYTTENANVNPNTPVAGTSLNDIFDGPFGSINSFNQGGAYQGVFTDVPGTGIEILANDANNNPTVGLDLFTNDIVVGDIGIFCSGGAGVVTPGPGVNNNNDILILNIFALACELSGETIETFEDIEICEGETVEVFGNPVDMSGVFSETYTASNDCDSVHTITVTVFPVFETSEAAEICDGETFDIFGDPIGVAGVYSQTFTSAAGCDSTHTVTLAVFPVYETSENLEICDGETVQIFGNPVGTAGDYSETFTSSDGCDSTHTVSLIVNPVFETSEAIEICEGETIDIFGDPVGTAGVYNETFTSSDGCDSTHTITVTVLPAPETFETIVICDNESADIFGNTVNTAGNYSETFTTAEGCDSIHTISLEVLPTFQTAENFSICLGELIDIFGVPTGSAGTYEMTFTAANGCDSTHTINLTVYEPIQLDIQFDDADCAGGTDGSASVSASGGVGNFNYSWSNGNTSSTNTGLGAGTYGVTVIDGAGCSASATVTISEPNPIIANAIGINITCDELGSASATAFGGTGNLSFEWNTGATTSGINNLLAGIYVVTVTDENDCTGTASVTLTGGLGPDWAVVNIDQNVTEDEPDSGAISVQTMGGTPPFNFDWNNGASGSSLSGLSAGYYEVTITDANDCTITAAASLFVPACTGGNIWNDRNRNGCREGGEPGISEVTLILNGTDIWGNTVSDTTTSDFFGAYLFEDLPPGNYAINMEVPNGYNISPLNACVDDFSDNDFGANGMTQDVITLVEGHCCLIVHGGLYDACGNVYDPGTICCDQVICGPGNVPSSITSQSSPQGASNLEYMWLFANSNYNGSWQVLKNAFGQPIATSSYAPGPLSETTHFIRCVRAVGCEEWLETNIVSITVDDIAVAAIHNPEMVCVGDPVTFSAYNNPAGASYSWNFGYGANPATSNATNPTVTWNQWGYKKVSLTVSYNGCTSTDEIAFIVSNSTVLCGDALISENDNSVAVTKSTFSEERNFAFYPNPASDVLNIEWNRDLDSAIQVEIISTTGRILFKDDLQPENMHHRIELADLTSGLYLLRIQYGEGQMELFQWVKM